MTLLDDVIRANARLRGPIRSAGLCLLGAAALGAADDRRLELREPDRELPGLDRPEVRVRDFGIVPFANLSHGDDRYRWHPTAFAAIGYDDNVFQESDGGVADTFAEGEVGLEFRNHLSRSSLLVVDGEIFTRRYQDQDTKDFDGWQFAVEHAYDDEVWNWNTRGFFRQQDDPALETGRTIERRVIGIGSDFVREGNAWEWFGGIDGTSHDFRESGITFGSEERDRISALAYAGLTRRTGEQASVSGRLWLLGTDYTNEPTPYQDYLGLRASAILVRPLGDRSRYEVEVGIEWREHDDDFAGIAAFDDETVVWPYLEAEWQWLYSDRGLATLTALSRTVDGAASNALFLYGLNARLEQRLPKRVDLVGSVGWVHRRASGSATGDEPESDSLTLEFEARYRFRTGFVVSAEVLHRRLEADDARGDYDQTIVSLTAAAAF